MFWHFSQNNSGGRFDFNIKSGITHHVVIEADNVNDANRRAEAIGIYFDGCDNDMDCPCCGDRWYKQSYFDKGDNEPLVYSKPVSNYTSFRWMEEGKEICVHYKDGSKVWF